ncbi:hypothetical protein C8F04DRAFT_1188946 [Mycena alexandri]|uniref:Uncharacterized protein n=1 Tax=Mycena alexandri TaxID=1745969 RepID=A0AAD6SHG9_9AGAR|nr:hypothetical protein C8F04DRAFT_1188946 [Mycena alexandri]
MPQFLFWGLLVLAYIDLQQKIDGAGVAMPIIQGTQSCTLSSDPHTSRSDVHITTVWLSPDPLSSFVLTAAAAAGAKHEGQTQPAEGRKQRGKSPPPLKKKTIPKEKGTKTARKDGKDVPADNEWGATPVFVLEPEHPPLPSHNTGWWTVTTTCEYKDV